MKVSTNRKSTVDEGSLDQYLRDISVFPLITREMEVELAKRIRQNDQDALDTLRQIICAVINGGNNADKRLAVDVHSADALHPWEINGA